MKLKYLFSSFSAILLGILFIVLQASVLDIVIKVFAAILVVMGILELVRLHVLAAIVKAALGVVVFIFGWKMMVVALYIVGALLILHGVLGLFALLRKRRGKIFVIFGLLSSAFCILAGVLLLFYNGLTLSWLFIAAGIALIVNGILSLVR